MPAPQDVVRARAANVATDREASLLNGKAISEGSDIRSAGMLIDFEYGLILTAESPHQIAESVKARLATYRTEPARREVPMEAALTALFEEADQAADTLGRLLFGQRAEIEAIESQLQRLHNSEALQQIEEAAHAMRSGLRRSAGRAQRDDYEDAIRLLKAVLVTATSRRDYSCWFRLGWLLWQTEAASVETEEAFYQASRLSADTDRNRYYLLATRHLAEIQRRNDNPEEPYETLKNALARDPETDDPLLLLDAGRAAARLGRRNEAMKLILASLALEPNLTAIVLAAPGLESLQEEFAAELLRRRNQVRAQAETESRYRNAILERLRRAETIAALEEPHALLSANFDSGQLEQLQADAIHHLGTVLREATETEARLKLQIKKLEDKLASWQWTLAALKKEARELGVKPDVKPSGGLFRRPSEKHQSLYMNYAACQSNIVSTSAEVDEKKPRIEALLNAATERRQRLEEALSVLREGETTPVS